MAAGQIHGSRTLTEDVDIVYKDDSENVLRLVAYLESVDAHVKELWPNEGYASDFSIERLLAEKSLTLGSREGEIDVLHRIDGIGGYDDVFASSEILTVDGRRARIITIDGLIVSKRAAQRPKDRLHVVELEAIQELKAKDT